MMIANLTLIPMLLVSLAGFVLTIYLVVLLIKALRKYLRSGEVRKEKAETKKTLGEALKAHRTRCKMTQEFVAESLGVSRQAVSKWESGQAVPDLDTVAKLCLALGFSADYLLFGRETAPAESAPAEPAPGPVYPDTCPCCGRPTSGGTLCPACGYPLPALPFPGPRYALTCGARYFASIGSAWEQLTQDFVQFCGKPDAYARELVRLMENGSDYRAVLRRDLPDSAALFLAQHLDRGYLEPKIVLDEGEPQQELLGKAEAMTIPARPASETKSGLGFWGVVGAVVVALLILSFL